MTAAYVARLRELRPEFGRDFTDSAPRGLSEGLVFLRRGMYMASDEKWVENVEREGRSPLTKITEEIGI